MQVDDLKHRCGVQFEDKSVSSVHFKDLQLLTNKEDSDGRSGDDDDDDDVSDVTCMLCRDGASEPPNEIVLCDKCGQGAVFLTPLSLCVYCLCGCILFFIFLSNFHL